MSVIDKNVATFQKHKTTQNEKENGGETKNFSRLRAKKKTALFPQKMFLLVGPHDQQRREFPLCPLASRGGGGGVLRAVLHVHFYRGHGTRHAAACGTPGRALGSACVRCVQCFWSLLLSCHHILHFAAAEPPARAYRSIPHCAKSPGRSNIA